MRLSVRKDDPGFDYAKACNCKIVVDGDDVTSICYTADEEKGMAWCLALNSDGENYVDEATGETAEVILQGKVEIIILQNGTEVS
ncbi:hypothetical protein LCGC14_2536410 [marine sediment metagenome]|uniref:Uncharacterized protein n=1 Tax=marine sediment metagenome TaxID=412755 RepID=A0A0F9DK41_9ZZZZ